MRRRRKRAKRWAALLLALPLAAGIVLFAAHLHRIFLEYAINECEDNALMEIGSLMEDEVYAHPERYASLVQLDYDSERHVTALRTDVVAIGRIKSRLVNGLYDRLDEFEQTVIEVPLGSVLAPHFFSGRGPSLHFGLAGLTQMEAEFVSSFSAAGINQTRHCILIEFHAGFRILTWTYTDFRYISNAKRPITKMADMQGLKFRVPQSAVLIAAYKAFGGSPTPISWAETFTALQQGVVDGQCYGYIGFKAMKFNEANQKYLTEVHYTYQLQPLVISERVFKKMTPEMQKVIVDAGKYAQDAVLKFQLENAEAAKKELIAGGLVVSQLEDEDLWKKAAIEKVWPEMADFVGGKDAINEYLKACGKDAWK